MLIPLSLIRKKLSKLYVSKLRANYNNLPNESILIQVFINDLKLLSNGKLTGHPLLTLEQIQITVCNYFDIHPRMLKRNTKEDKVAKSRQMSMFFATQYTNYSYITIAREIGNKKQTGTVSYAKQTAKSLIETNLEYRTQINELTRKLDRLC